MMQNDMYDIEDMENENVQSSRALLTNPEQLVALETVLYKVVELYNRATKEHESHVQWQAKFARLTQGFEDNIKNLVATKEAISGAINTAFKKVMHDAGSVLGEAAAKAAEKEMTPIAQRFSKVCDEGERQLREYATETKTFFWKILVTSGVTSIATGLLIILCLVPSLSQPSLPLTESQLRDLQLGSQVRSKWLATPDKNKKQMKEILGNGASFYLESHANRG